MIRAAWLTDIHLNFVDVRRRREFFETLRSAAADVMFISGDIGESHDVLEFLTDLEAVIARPIYFVLGNHDFYGGSIPVVRQRVTELAKASKHLRYLTAAGVIELSPSTALIGHDGWADARLGDYERSDVLLNDYQYIAELTGFDKTVRRQRLEALGDEAAASLAALLPAALEHHRRVVVVTHVPPFREACWHEGRTSDDLWLPHFSCQAVGLVLRDAMLERPDRDMLVLCGHTHGAGQARLLDNLQVLTGGAEYRHPKIQQIFEFE